MNAETNTTDPRIEAAAEELAKNDGWLSLKHPSPATQKTLREHASLVVATIDAVDLRKTRTITTVEELDALPATTIIRASNGEVFQRDTDGPYYDGPHDWQSFEGTFWNGETFVFPATVLYTPEAAE